jgi:transposase
VLALSRLLGADVVLTNEQWAVLEPLVEACRPHAKVPPSNLRRTIAAIIWRHTNGAKWRAIPDEFGPWWVRALPGRRRLAAQTFIRWSRLGVWERLLATVQARGVELGMAFLDGTSIRAHQNAYSGDRGQRFQAIVGTNSTASWAGVMPMAWWIRKADWRQAFRLARCAWRQCDACFLP